MRLTVWTLQTISSAAHLPLQAVRTRSNLQCLEKRYEHSPACKSSPPRPCCPQAVRTRSNLQCLEKWYDQLSPSMVERGEWGPGDDRRLLRALYRR